MRNITTAGAVYGPTFGQESVVQSQVVTGQTANGTASPAQATAAIPVTTVFGNLRSSVVAQPIVWLFGFVLFLVAWKLVEEHRGGREIYHEVKVGGSNMVKIGVMALVFFAIARFITKRYQVPGFSPFVQFAVGGGNG